jgi:methionyl-tRNA formyltransferase
MSELQYIHNNAMMRIKVFGSGPIYDETRAICERRGHTIVEERPYDLVVLANVLRILKAPEIAEAGLGVICFHPSMLPRHRGGDAVYWTFKMGDTESGITWFWVDEGIDTGPIAIQAAVPIPAESSPSKLYFETLVPLGARLFDELLAKLERGERPSIVQDESRATFELRRPPKPKV